MLDPLQPTAGADHRIGPAAKVVENKSQKNLSWNKTILSNCWNYLQYLLYFFVWFFFPSEVPLLDSDKRGEVFQLRVEVDGARRELSFALAHVYLRETGGWSRVRVILDWRKNSARSVLWRCDETLVVVVVVPLTRTQVDISHPFFFSKKKKNMYIQFKKIKHVSLKIRQAFWSKSPKGFSFSFFFYVVIIAMIAGMYDCHLQMVVISVPASGDDNPMLTLYGELPCVVAHLIYSLPRSFVDVSRPRFWKLGPVPPLTEKKKQKKKLITFVGMWHFIFWVLYIDLICMSTDKRQ